MRLAIVGTGLIGASAGLAAHRAGFASVAGWDEDPGVLEVAASGEP
jgi:prephenate dehydrogenase